MVAAAAARQVDRKLRTVTVADAATAEVRRRIMAGEYADGTRLESEGLVVGSPHRGYIVKGLSRDEIEELFDLRSLLEPDLIRIAIPMMTEADFAYAENLLAQYAEGLDTADVRHWGELNVQYHMALYAPSRRTRTLDFVRGLLVNTDRYTRLVLTLDEGPDDAKEDHAGLLEYCRKGAVNQAVALTRDHIQRASANLLAMLESRDR